LGYNILSDPLSLASLDLNTYNNLDNINNKPVFNLNTKFDYITVNKVEEKALGIPLLY